MKYVQPSRKPKYEDGDGKISVEGREKGVQRLVAANLLKRLESSVASFRLTLERVLSHMEHTLDAIDRFRTSGTSVPGDLLEDANGFDYDVDDEETSEFMVGKKARYDLRDMDWVSWERDIMADAQIVRDLLDLVAPIDPSTTQACRAQAGYREQGRPSHQRRQPQGHRLYRVRGHRALPLRAAAPAGGGGVGPGYGRGHGCRGRQDHGGRRARRPLGDPHLL